VYVHALQDRGLKLMPIGALVLAVAAVSASVAPADHLPAELGYDHLPNFIQHLAMCAPAACSIR
jgi:hypothetical protein